MVHERGCLRFRFWVSWRPGLVYTLNYWRWAYATCLVIAFASLEAGMASRSSLPLEVVRELEAQVDGLRSIDLAWDIEKECPLELDELLRRVHCPDYMRVLEPETREYHWQDGLFRYSSFGWERVSSAPGRRWRTAELIACDGQNVYTAHPPGNDIPGDIQVTLMIDPLARAEREYPGTEYMCSLEVPWAAGIHFPNGGAEISMRPQSEVLYLLEHGARLTEVMHTQFKGADCLVVKVRQKWDLLGGDEREHQFYLDPSKHYAVLCREIHLASGELYSRWTNRDLTQAGHRPHWIPRRTDVELFYWHDPPRVFKPVDAGPYTRMRITLTRFSEDALPLDQFSVDYRHIPGAVIMDGTHPEVAKSPQGRVFYRVPSDPSKPLMGD